MSINFEDVTLALAGIFQAASLVDTLANTGTCDEAAFKTSIHSILKLDAHDVVSIYDGSRNLALGLQQLKKAFGRSQDKPNTDIGRYVISILHLARKFIKNEDMIKKVRFGVQQAQTQVAYFSGLNPNVIANFAELYKKTLGGFSFRIQIRGRSDFLHKQDIADKCRALLLAGIRSAVLWQQVGGTRFQLLLSRRKYFDVAEKILRA